MKIFSPILKGTTTVSQGTTNLSGSFTGSLFGTAATASYADNFTVGGTLTAQTINVQIITSSIEFVTGSTKNGSLAENTHQFTGSVFISGSSTEINSPLHVGGSLMGQLNRDNAPLFKVVSGASTSTRSGIAIKDSWNGTNNDNSYIYFFVGTGSGEREAIRVINNGNVGIGTTSPAAALHVNGGALPMVIASTSATELYCEYRYNTTSVLGYIGNGTGLATGAGQTNFGIRAQNDLFFAAGGNAERMRITSAGNVGIGTATPFGKFNVFVDTNKSLVVQDSGQADTLEITNYSTSGGLRNILFSSAILSFYTGVAGGGNATERMRITSGGNILIAKTNDTTPAETIVGLQFNGARILCTVDGTYSAFSRLSSDGDVLTFHRGSTSKIGSISVTTSATAYNTSASDIRLKKNFENWDENILLSFEDLNPQKFNFNSQEDGTDKVKGFIAQEVVDKFPEAYPIDDNGFYSFNPSGMTIYLMKAIQELKSENDTLKEILQRNNIQ
jgi:hypothetical protein